MGIHQRFTLTGSPPETPDVRLYSTGHRLPVDVVAEQHQEIHAELERWGAWNAERYKPASVGSVESRYREATAKATADSIPPSIMAIERAVLRMPRPHRDIIRMFYVTRDSPSYICRAHVLRPRTFQTWMFNARAMVVNLLRRHGNGN
jgi:hypothetical protein